VGLSVLAVRALRGRAKENDAPDEGEAEGTQATEAVETEADGAPERSALAELFPTRAEELILPATGLALLLSYFAPSSESEGSPWLSMATPSRALAGLLAGITVMKVHEAWRSRHVRGAKSAEAQPTELWALVGSLAGVPATAASLVMAAVVGASALAVGRPLGAGLRRLAAADAARSGVAATSAAATRAPTEGMPAEDAEPVPAGALPLGVFLGLGSAFALFAGTRAIEWYLDLSSGFVP